MYAITRLGKKVHTHQELKTIQLHNSRLMPVSHLAGPALAVQLKGTGMLNDDVGKLLPTKIRKNAVLAVEMLYTASPEYFRPSSPESAGHWERDRLERWQEATMSYLSDRWGDRLASATLHLDESTPHIHAIVVPLDQRGKLNCRDVFNRAALIDNQSSYASALQHLGLLRGLEGSKAKHEDIKQYYKRVSEPTPIVKTPRPDRPETSSLDAVKRALGFNTTTALTNDQREIQREQRVQELKSQRNAERAKAAQFDAMRRREVANTNLIAKLREDANIARDLPLEPILEKLGAIRSAKDQNNWESSVGRISVQGMRFFNHDLNFGGGGAIDLVMHIGELAFKEALSWLGGNLGVGPTIGVAMAQAKMEAVLATAAPIKLLKPPLRSEDKWPEVRNYLLNQRHVDAAVVDSAYQAGLIYADKYQNLVFLNSTTAGCELRGTREGVFHGQRGKKAPFILPALSGNNAALVESGIDALSLRALGFTGMIMAFGGQAKKLIAATAQELLEKGWNVICAFDNDDAGRNMAADVDLALMGLHQPARMTPITKDWNDDLKLHRCQLNLPETDIQRHSSEKIGRDITPTI